MMRRILTTGCAVILVGAFLSGCRISPQARRDKYVAAGKQFLQEKDYGRAVLQFKNAAQAMPKDAEVYYQIGVAFSGAKDYGSAVRAFRKALEVNPKHVEAQLRLAQLMAATNDEALLKDAQSRLKSLLEGASATPEMLNTLALTELKLGDAEGATQSLERLLTQAPGELDSSLILAKAKLSRNDPKGAEAVLEKACNNAPKSADARRLLGEFYIYQQRMPAAEAQLRQALAIDSKNGLALMDLARLQLAGGRKQEAEQCFKQLAALEGYKSVYAVFLFDEQRHDEAIREFDRLAKENPDDRQARTRLVVAYRLANRGAEADKTLEGVLKKNPKDVDALLQRGEVFIEKRDYARAEADLNQVLRLRPNAPEVHYVFAKLNQARGGILMYRQELSKTLELNPALEAVRVELARNLIQSNEGRAALNVLDSAPEFQKRSSLQILVQRNWALWATGNAAEMRKGIDLGFSWQKTADLLVQDGLWKLRANNPTGARAALEEALKIDSSDLLALQALNQTYLAQNKGNEALQKVQQYAALQPKSASVQEFLGVMLMVHGDRPQARNAFAAAKLADPSFVNADLSLVQLDVLDGKLDQARRTLLAMLSTNGDNTTARKWLGTLEEVRGDHNAAIDHFRKVLEANAADAQASNNLAFLLAEYRNQADEALKYAQRAVELSPERPAYCDTLGWVLYKKGLYTAAIPYLKRASAEPGNVVWNYHLAMAYAKAGDIRHGKATLAAALKLNPNVPEAKAAQEVLAAFR